MDISSNFIDIVDRYLELSNVYHQRIQGILKGSEILEEVSDRYTRLLTLLEKVNIDSDPINFETLEPTEAKGRTMVPTSDLLNQTQRQQKIVLDRLENNTPIELLPRNLQKLRKVLNLPSKSYLGHFPTVSYAWDILTELSSLTVLPDSKTLAARDMIYMHAIELQIHLAKIITQVKLTSPKMQISLKGNFSISELRRLNDSNLLIEKLIELTVPYDSDKLFEELISFIPRINSSKINDIFPHKDTVIKYLRLVNVSFPENLDQHKIEKAQEICETLVIFGLTAAYTAWCQVALQHKDEQSALRKSILFCTRILLDEKRWKVCRDFSSAALLLLNILDEDIKDSYFQGNAMIQANLFFSRIKCNEHIEEDIRAWETKDIHPRYDFIKKILLKDFDQAKVLAEKLLSKKKDGSSDLCIHEVKEWPILEDFRKTEHGKLIIKQYEQ